MNLYLLRMKVALVSNVISACQPNLTSLNQENLHAKIATRCIIVYELWLNTKPFRMLRKTELTCQWYKTNKIMTITLKLTPQKPKMLNGASEAPLSLLKIQKLMIYPSNGLMLYFADNSVLNGLQSKFNEI